MLPSITAENIIVFCHSLNRNPYAHSGRAISQKPSARCVFRFGAPPISFVSRGKNRIRRQTCNHLSANRPDDTFISAVAARANTSAQPSGDALSPLRLPRTQWLHRIHREQAVQRDHSTGPGSPPSAGLSLLSSAPSTLYDHTIVIRRRRSAPRPNPLHRRRLPTDPLNFCRPSRDFIRQPGTPAFGAISGPRPVVSVVMKAEM